MQEESERLGVSVHHPGRRGPQPVKSPVHAGPALEAARTVQLFSPEKFHIYFETLQHVRSSELHL